MNVLTVEVYGGSGFPFTSSRDDKMQLFIRVIVGSKERKTRLVAASASPVWGDELDYPIDRSHTAAPSKIEFEVYLVEPGEADERIGRGAIELRGLSSGEQRMELVKVGVGALDVGIRYAGSPLHAAAPHHVAFESRQLSSITEAQESARTASEITARSLGEELDSLSLRARKAAALHAAPAGKAAAGEDPLEGAVVTIQRFARGFLARQQTRELRTLLADLEREEEERRRIDEERAEATLRAMDAQRQQEEALLQRNRDFVRSASMQRRVGDEEYAGLAAYIDASPGASASVVREEVRGEIARRATGAAPPPLASTDEAAVVTIQRFARGFLARQQTRELRSLLAELEAEEEERRRIDEERAEATLRMLGEQRRSDERTLERNRSIQRSSSIQRDPDAPASFSGSFSAASARASAPPPAAPRSRPRRPAAPVGPVAGLASWGGGSGRSGRSLRALPALREEPDACSPAPPRPAPPAPPSSSPPAPAQRGRFPQRAGGAPPAPRPAPRRRLPRPGAAPAAAAARPAGRPRAAAPEEEPPALTEDERRTAVRSLLEERQRERAAAEAAARAERELEAQLQRGEAELPEPFRRSRSGRRLDEEEPAPTPERRGAWNEPASPPGPAPPPRFPSPALSSPRQQAAPQRVTHRPSAPNDASAASRGAPPQGPPRSNSPPVAPAPLRPQSARARWDARAGAGPEPEAAWPPAAAHSARAGGTGSPRVAGQNAGNGPRRRAGRGGGGAGGRGGDGGPAAPAPRAVDEEADWLRRRLHVLREENVRLQVVASQLQFALHAKEHQLRAAELSTPLVVPSGEGRGPPPGPRGSRAAPAPRAGQRPARGDGPAGDETTRLRMELEEARRMEQLLYDKLSRGTPPTATASARASGPAPPSPPALLPRPPPAPHRRRAGGGSRRPPRPRPLRGGC
eukprot:tig00020780_g13800.t1